MAAIVTSSRVMATIGFAARSHHAGEINPRFVARCLELGLSLGGDYVDVELARAAEGAEIAELDCRDLVRNFALQRVFDVKFGVPFAGIGWLATILGTVVPLGVVMIMIVILALDGDVDLLRGTIGSGRELEDGQRCLQLFLRLL